MNNSLPRHLVPRAVTHVIDTEATPTATYYVRSAMDTAWRTVESASLEAAAVAYAKWQWRDRAFRLKVGATGEVMAIRIEARTSMDHAVKPVAFTIRATPRVDVDVEAA